MNKVFFIFFVSLAIQTANAENGIIVYVVPPITDTKILPTSFISADYISNTISITASPGEYEPASFVIHAQQTIPSLEIKTSTLTGTSDSITSDNIDIRVVKCWYQSGVEIWDISHKLLTPELLLKDDSLVQVTNGNNYLKLTTGQYAFISDTTGTSGIPDAPLIDSFPVKDSPILLPVSIDGGTNKQFWLTLKVPDNTTPGIYNGKITLKITTDTMEEIQLKVEVLPIKLSKPCLTYSIYYSSYLADYGTISKGAKNEEQFRAELKDLFDHGITNPNVFYQESLSTVLGIRNEIGIDTQALYYLGLQTDTYGDSLDSLKDAVTNLKNLSAAYGVTELYISAPDEQYLNTPDQRAQIEAVHQAGGKVLDAQFNDHADAIADVLDLAVAINAPVPTLAAKYHGYGHKIFSYSNPQCGEEKPETYRRNYGLLLWQKDYDGAMDFAYHWNFSNIWNDFDWWLCRDHNLTYPTMTGVIGTIQWEGWREAVDDVRYLTTLFDAMHKATQNGKDTTAAGNWVDSLKTLDLNAQNMDSIRAIMVKHILSFQDSVADTIKPVITLIKHSPITFYGTKDISWNTDERANGQVEYGTSVSLDSSTALNSMFELNHKLPITELIQDTVYYFRVKSGDPSGNLAVSSMDSFNTYSSLSIAFTPPTENNDTIINHLWTEIKTSITTTCEATSFIDWNRSLRGYWNFNEDSGTIVADTSTYNNNGTFYKIDTSNFWIKGRIGNALKFDGNGYVDCGNDSSLNCSTAVTVEGWIKPYEYSGVILFQIIGFEEHKSYQFWQWSDTTNGYKCYVWEIYNDGTRRFIDVSTDLLPIDEWTHITLLYDNGYLKVYKNAKLFGSKNVGIITLPANVGNLKIGNIPFKGVIDEIKIWNRALSQDEINVSYNSSAHNLFYRFPNLTDGESYEFYAYASDLNGHSAKTETRKITIDTSIVSVEEASDTLPKTYSLSQNYPNPFTKSTVIKYQLPAKSKVSLKLYDLSGRCVKELVNKEKLPGYYKITLTPKNYPNGIYFAKFSAGAYRETRKLILMK
ncbi:MAG: T9SS type A sorting domain-containing protein [bacterium]|nr:T9SS type A sorting domain-containing protein [bacterium]